MSIEANEIRQGVYLKWENNGSIFDVTVGIMLQGSFWTHLSNGDIVPIPLTPQLLEKIGFKDLHTEFCPTYQKDQIQIEIVDGTYMARLQHGDKEDSTSLWLCDLISLHQLQNLYFALTNTELKIEL